MLDLIKVCMNCFKICLTKKEKPVVGAGVAKKAGGRLRNNVFDDKPNTTFRPNCLFYFIENNG